MASDQHAERRIRQAQRSAQITSLVFGISLLVWGLAPAIVQRLVSGKTPTFGAYAMGACAIALGLCFMVLAICVGRGALWAIWATLCVSVLLLFAALATAFLSTTGPLSLYPVLLSACTAGTSWLALVARRAVQPAGQPGPAT